MSLQAATLKNWFNRLLLLWSTAFPGLQRVILVFLIERLYGKTLLGEFSNDTGILGMVGFYTAVGFCTLVMVQLPALAGAAYQSRKSGLLVLTCLSCLVSAPVLWALYRYTSFLHSLGGGFLYLFGWSGYQVWRHELIARKQYLPLTLQDAGLLLLSLLALFAWPRADLDHLLMVQSLPYLALFCVLLAASLRRPGMRAELTGHQLHHAFHFGTINLLSGGAMMALAPLATQLAGLEYAALLGVIMTVLNIVLMFPRAISFNLIPDLARNRHDKINIRRLFKKSFILIIGITLGFCVILLAGWFVGGASSHYWVFQTPSATAIFLLFLVYLATSQMAVPSSGILQVFEMAPWMSRISAIYFVATLAPAGLLMLLKVRSLQVLVFYLVWICLSTAGRAALLHYKAATVIEGLQDDSALPAVPLVVPA